MLKLLDYLNDPNFDSGDRIKLTSLLQDLQNFLPESGTPVDSVKASGTLTLGGSLLDGETITIGDEVYEIDTEGVVSDGNVAVDVSGDACTAAQGEITMDTNPSSGQNVTIGSSVYTFVTNGVTITEGQVELGTGVSDTQENLVAAINGTDEVNSPNPDVTAADFDTNTCLLTANVPGTGANSMVFTTDMDGGTNAVDGSGTFGDTTAGVDMTADDQLGVLETVINGASDLVTTTADTDADTLALEALDGGADYNSVATTEVSGDGSFGATTLENGVSGTEGKLGKIFADDTNIYIAATQDNTVGSAVWKKVAHASL